MHRATAFRQDDPQALHRLIREAPLATLVSHGDAGLQATHMPLLLAPDEGPHGTLYGHFARANPHWRTLADGAALLAIFQGPHAYVSPAWYPSKAEHGKAVPTWDYLAVHARGEAELFDDAERLRTLLGALSATHEQGRPKPWSMEEAPRDYLDTQLRAIVGLRLPIRQLDGAWKLSQNRSEADVAGVVAGLRAEDDPVARQLAERVAAPRI
ncbi:FMN-binding negative transcriptional regulator [Pseudomonas mangiferae]|uniref:FMN-binding negative transcriptional regulator n=1 Tax=Pseudomonas mangiferae TaxID=2593654 RepID=A0A553GVA8_9PSED|nr:FMN-binding negative transcriptional regulator [Pseudomonas mangiferae]TRX73444.1 FMN-binding negative transcriptional regulator [Pseudomonas mangiferae]